jgi:glycosyltransferase involved in cell wall biosynthesis
MSGLARTQRVSLLSLSDAEPASGDSLSATEQYCERVEVVRNPRAGGLAAKRGLQLASIASTRSYERLMHEHADVQRALDSWLSREHFDVVQFEFPYMSGYRVRGYGVSRPMLCLDEHNIEYDMLRRVARSEAGLLRRAYCALAWRKLRAEERQSWRRMDGCVVTSSRDIALLARDAPNAARAIVPNGVDVDYFKRPPGAASDPATLLFFGAMDYFPNTDAALYFVREVLPIIAAARPEVRVRIVGRNPPASVVALAGERVKIIGLVGDVRTEITRASVVIAPLRLGGGTRLKILEAMSMGASVVSTSLGAEGLELGHEREILVGDTPQAFAAATLRLLAAPELRDALGARARARVACDYSWADAVARLAEFHARLLSRRAAR